MWWGHVTTRYIKFGCWSQKHDVFNVVVRSTWIGVGLWGTKGWKLLLLLVQIDRCKYCETDTHKTKCIKGSRLKKSPNSKPLPSGLLSDAKLNINTSGEPTVNQITKFKWMIAAQNDRFPPAKWKITSGCWRRFATKLRGRRRQTGNEMFYILQLKFMMWNLCNEWSVTGLFRMLVLFYWPVAVTFELNCLGPLKRRCLTPSNALKLWAISRCFQNSSYFGFPAATD